MTVSGCIGQVKSSSSGNEASFVESVNTDGYQDTNVKISSSIVDRQIDKESTAKIRITVTWAGRENQRVTFGNSVPFSTPKYPESDENIVLLDSDREYEMVEDGNWIPKTGESGSLQTGELVLSVAELSPDQSVSHSWEIWGNPESSSYIEKGEYGFSDSIGLGGEGDTVDWSLSVTIR